MAEHLWVWSQLEGAPFSYISQQCRAHALGREGQLCGTARKRGSSTAGQHEVFGKRKTPLEKDRYPDVHAWERDKNWL